MWICETCGVEHAERHEVCVICADERQWIPAGGQRWTTLDQLREAGSRVSVEALEPGLLQAVAEPAVGIGQHMHIVLTEHGNLLWDPLPYLDTDAVRRVRELGEVSAIAASHPHMFGAQVEWSRALGDVPVLVCEADAGWVQRPDPAIAIWSGRREVAPGLTLHQLGGHFPGSAVAHWAEGDEGRGVLLSSDTIQANPDLSTVTLLRSYPNRIPLSPRVVERIVGAVTELPFNRLYDNVGRRIEADAAEAVRRSAERYRGWVGGDFDALT